MRCLFSIQISQYHINHQNSFERAQRVYKIPNFQNQKWSLFWSKTTYALLSFFSFVQLFATCEMQPARLLCPWNSPGKNTGVCYHSPLQGSNPVSHIAGRFFSGYTPLQFSLEGPPKTNKGYYSFFSDETSSFKKLGT